MCAHKISPTLFRIPTERLWNTAIGDSAKKSPHIQRVTEQLIKSLRSILAARSCILLFARFWFHGEKVILLATFFIWVSTNFYTQFRRKTKERRYATLHARTSTWALLLGIRRRLLNAYFRLNKADYTTLLIFRHYTTLLSIVFTASRAALANWYTATRKPLQTLVALASTYSALSTRHYVAQDTQHYPILIPVGSFALNKTTALYSPISTLRLPGFTFCCAQLSQFLTLTFYHQLHLSRQVSTWWTKDIFFNAITPKPLVLGLESPSHLEKCPAWSLLSITAAGYNGHLTKLRFRSFQSIFRLSGARYWWGGHQGVVLRCSLINIVLHILRENAYSAKRDISMINRLKLFCRVHWERIRVITPGVTQNNTLWRQTKRLLDFILFVRSIFSVKFWTTAPQTASLFITLEDISAHLSVTLLLVQDKLLARLQKRIRRKFVPNTIRATVVAVLINSAQFLTNHIAEELRLMKKHFIFLSGFRRILRSVLLNIPLFTTFRLVASGKVGGAKRTKRYVMQLGPRVVLGTIQSSVDYAQANVETIYGSLGLKVWIVKSSYQLT